MYTKGTSPVTLVQVIRGKVGYAGPAMPSEAHLRSLHATLK